MSAKENEEKAPSRGSLILAVRRSRGRDFLFPFFLFFFGRGIGQ
jgi:hypothetical protein